jgi:hypothetical protein
MLMTGLASAIIVAIMPSEKKESWAQSSGGRPMARWLT